MTAAALLAWLVLGQSEAPVMDAEVGYANRAFEDSWVPVVARLRTARKPFEGWLVARVQGMFGDERECRQRVSLPVPTDRRIELDFFGRGSEVEVEVALETLEGTAIAKASFKPRWEERRACSILVVGDMPRSLERGISGLDAAAVRTRPENFPGTLAPLLAFEAIVFPEPADLNYAQYRAIRQWIDLGGRLVTSGGARSLDWNSNELNDLVPVRIRGTSVREGTTEDEVPYRSPVANFERAPGVELLFTDLGARAKRGRGETVFLAFGLLDPIQCVAPAAVWRAVLGVGAAPDEQKIYNSATATWIDWGRSPVRLNPAGFWAGGGLALLYVLLIGPLSGWMRRWRPLSRASVRFAACVVVFSAAFLLLGGRLSPVSPQVRHLVLVDCGDEVSAVQSFSVIDAGSAGVYRVSGPGEAELSVIGDDMPALTADAMPTPAAENASTLRLPMPAHTRQKIAAVRTAPVLVRCRRVPEAGDAIEVENLSPGALRDCLLISKFGVIEVGIIGCGKQSIDLSGARVKSIEQWADGLVRKDDVERGWSFGRSAMGRVVKPDSLDLTLSLLERCQPTFAQFDSPWQHWVPQRPGQRLVDLSGLLDEDVTIFLGRSETDLSGLSVDRSMPVEFHGLVRAVVKP